MLKHDKYLENAFCNVGDTIQDLAMDYIFSGIPIKDKDVRFISRDDKASEILFNEEITMVANAVFFQKNTETHIPFPPNISPVFFSVLVSHDLFSQYPQVIEYIKCYEPIGCRDEQSKQIFKKYGIDAYLMGCCTVCFPKRNGQPCNGKVFFVDTPEELDSYIPKKLRDKAVYLSHAVPLKYPVDIDEDKRQKAIAQDYLDRYKNEAELVVTSRLHAAIPCLAMGIPVILVRDNFDSRFGWVDKFLPLYYLDEADRIDWNPSAVDIEEVKHKYISYMRKLLLGLPNREKHLVELDDFYTDRNRVLLNKMIHEKVDAAFLQLESEDIAYGIWGAGVHCKIVHSIIKQMHPNAKLVVIVDKYIKGNLFGVPIITGDMLNGQQVDHMFITTLPGKEEAISKMQELYGINAASKYTIITSRMLC